jgi:hypothetical protein
MNCQCFGTCTTPRDGSRERGGVRGKGNVKEEYWDNQHSPSLCGLSIRRVWLDHLSLTVAGVVTSRNGERDPTIAMRSHHRRRLAIPSSSRRGFGLSAATAVALGESLRLRTRRWGHVGLASWRSENNTDSWSCSCWVLAVPGGG